MQQMGTHEYHRCYKARLNRHAIEESKSPKINIELKKQSEDSNTSKESESINESL